MAASSLPRTIPLLLALALSLSPLSTAIRVATNRAGTRASGSTIVNTCAPAGTCSATPSVSPIAVNAIVRFTVGSAFSCLAQCQNFPRATYYEFNPRESPGIILLPSYARAIFRTAGSCYCFTSCVPFSVDPSAYNPQLSIVASTLARLNTTTTAGFLDSCSDVVFP